MHEIILLNERLDPDYTKIKGKISIVMPAYNLKDKILESVNKVCYIVNKIAEDYEVIVVDDGSTDGTYFELLKLNNEKVIPLRNNRNVGKGYAVKRGVLKSTGEYIIILDADMEIKYDSIISYLKALKHYDIIIASKRHPKSKYDAPIIRKILSLGFNALVRLLTGVKVSDTQTGLKAFRGHIAKKIMRVILVKRYAFDVEVLAVAGLLNLKIYEQPVNIKQRKSFSLKSIFLMFIDLLGITYRLRILKWYQKNLLKKYPEYKPIIKL